MNKLGKIAIVAALAVVVGVVLVAKQNQNQASPSSGAAGPGDSVSQAGGSQDAKSSPPQEKGGLPRLVDLGAGKCIPCKKMAPILETLKKEYAGRMDVEFIDVWENPRAGDLYGVRMIPTQIFYDAAGKELFRHEGFYSREDILGKWRELGVGIETKVAPN